MEDHDVEYMEKEKEALKEKLIALGEEIKVVAEGVTKANEVKAKIQLAIQAKNNELSSAKVANQEKKSITQRIDQLDEWLLNLRLILSK